MTGEEGEKREKGEEGKEGRREEEESGPMKSLRREHIPPGGYMPAGTLSTTRCL